jgi:hypothetical protein
VGTSIDYSTVAHETIYRNITGGSGAAALHGASRAWEGVATKLARIQDYVDQAVRGIGVAQQGAAADAATQASMPLVGWVSDAVTVAQGLASRIAGQAELFTHTRDSMPEPRTVSDPAWNQDPAEWAADGLIDWLPGAQTEEEGARVQAQQDEQRARDLMIAYQRGTNENLADPPQFDAAPRVVADAAVPPRPGSDGADGDPRHGSGADPVRSAAAPPPAAGPKPPPAAGPAQPPSAPAPTPAQLSTGYSQQPGPIDIGPGQARVGPQPGFGPAPPFAGTGGSGLVRGGPGAPPRRMGGRGAGGPPPVPRGGFGPRPLRTSFGAPGPTEPTGAKRAPASGADAGTGMAPVGGGSDAPDGTDYRKPSYLVEPDTNAIIGDLPLVCPPVIGEDLPGEFR